MAAASGEFQAQLAENMDEIRGSMDNNDKSHLCDLLTWRVKALDYMCSEASVMIEELNKQVVDLINDNERLRRILARGT